MADDDYGLRDVAEEIEGAPALLSDAEQLARMQDETVTINRFAVQQTRRFERALYQSDDLVAVLDVLLVQLPRQFGFLGSELWLHDPDGALQSLFNPTQRQMDRLRFVEDASVLTDLYASPPGQELLEATDPRMFEVLKSDRGVGQALILPLLHDDYLYASLHCGAEDLPTIGGEAEWDMIDHSCAMIAACLYRAIEQERRARLSLLDPMTAMLNHRGFDAELARELSRARREARPVSILMVEIDDLHDLCKNYGDHACAFVLKRVSQRIQSDLRATDCLARLDGERLAVLLPGCGELRARDVAERSRAIIASMDIDDGRGAVLHVTVSIGFASWESAQYPALDMVRLSNQLQNEAARALKRALDNGGDSLAVARLSTPVT